jgi:hypothetical protein
MGELRCFRIVELFCPDVIAGAVPILHNEFFFNFHEKPLT